MGGEWGIGTSLAMETVSSKWRGILSGIVQNGYSMGYFLAALAYRFAFPVWGWRPMFWLGGLPALLALYIRMRVPESEAWKQHRAPSMNAVFDAVAKQWKLCRTCALNVVHDVSLSRHAGSVSRFFENCARGWHDSHFEYRNSREHRRDRRRNNFWQLLAKHRPAKKFGRLARVIASR